MLGLKRGEAIGVLIESSVQVGFKGLGEGVE